jgi:hypothetical protein
MDDYRLPMLSVTMDPILAAEGARPCAHPGQPPGCRRPRHAWLSAERADAISAAASPEGKLAASRPGRSEAVRALLRRGPTSPQAGKACQRYLAQAARRGPLPPHQRLVDPTTWFPPDGLPASILD